MAEIPKEVLTRWAEECLHMNHLGTLLGRELKGRARSDQELARAVDLAERARVCAWRVLNELFDHGADKPEGYCEPGTPGSEPVNTARVR
jgi:hypothetical protein